MADDANDDDNSDDTLMLPLPNGNLYAQRYDEIIDEVVETLHRKQKILTKIICVPGKKTFVADWMKQTYEILLEADPDTSIVTPSGLSIKQLSDFPTGQKFKDAFKPLQSDDTKNITMHFHLDSAPPLHRIKSKHRRLVDHLQTHKIYMDESFSGSDDEVLIGYFMGIQADKLYLTGFSDDLRHLIKHTKLQPGEIELKNNARKALEWNGDDDKTPPFHVKVRNVTRKYQGAEYASKAVGMIVAREHATFFKSLLKRTGDDKSLSGTGTFYNVVQNDRTFHRIIKWHNDQISNTAILPVVGITLAAMNHPLKVKRVTDNKEGYTTTSIRAELCNSGLFNSIHSTRQTADEGRWILVIANKSHTEAATKHFHSLIQSVYAASHSQIQQNDLDQTYPMPQTEDREQTQARSNDQVRSHQSNAWHSLFSESHQVTGGSTMRNMNRSKPRRIVEISFDSESSVQFPYLPDKKNQRQQSRTNRKQQKSAEHTSPTSSQGDSFISAVTRAEFETLSLGIGKMIKDEVQSTMTNGTDQTMLTIFRDEMTASRIETQKQITLIQTQMTTFQNLLTGLLPHLALSAATTPTSNNTTCESSTPGTHDHLDLQHTDTIDIDSTDTPQTQPQASPSAEPYTRSSSKKVSMATDDHSMPDNVSHNAPSMTDDTPPPKRHNTGTNIKHLTPLPSTRTKTGHRVFPPSSSPKTKSPLNSTTVNKKINGGRS
jgi:hypothetical protein